MKSMVMSAAAFVLTTTAAIAQYVGPNDGAPANAVEYPASTVAAIKAEPKDDAKVTLEGTIARKVGDETYIFTDGSGEIEVEIDDEDFPNEPVDASTKVRIEGEVDTHLMKDVDIDADRVTILK